MPVALDHLEHVHEVDRLAALPVALRGALHQRLCHLAHRQQFLTPLRILLLLRQFPCERGIAFDKVKCPFERDHDRLIEDAVLLGKPRPF